MRDFKRAWASVILIATFCFAPARARADGPEDLLKSLVPFSRWKLESVVPLSSPGRADTGHPQGMIVEKDRLILSTERNDGGVLLFYALKRDATGKVLSAEYTRQRVFSEYKDLNHAGGITLAGDDHTVLVPLAGAYPNSRAVVLSFDTDTGKIGERIRLPFHTGVLLFDPDGDVLYLKNYVKSLYRFDLSSPQLQDYTDATLAPAFVPKSPVEYQDCKFMADRFFLCSGTYGHVFGRRGFLDLVHLNADGTYPEDQVVRIPVPEVNTRGQAVRESGLYIPGFIGDPPLTENPFDYEIIHSGKSLRLYFAPHNNPQTTLFVYEADVEE